MLEKKQPALFIVSVIILLVFASCSPATPTVVDSTAIVTDAPVQPPATESVPESPTEAPELTESLPTEPPAGPVRTDLIIGNYTIEGSSLDPRKPQGGIDPGTQLLFNALVRIDKNGNPQPDAATWTYPDDTTIVFTLHEGITFSDGTELTAEDVKFTFDTILDPDFGAPNIRNYEQIESIEVLDEHTVQFNLKEPHAPLIQFLSNSYTGIVPKHIAEADPEKFNSQPVGSGPYVLEKWTPAEEMVLVAREDYWEGAPKMKRVTIRGQEDDTVRLLQLESGAIDVAIRAPLGEVKRILEEGQYQVINTPPTGFEFIGFMLDKPPFDNVLVRQALAHAIDRNQIVESVFFGLTEPSYGVCPPSLWCYNPDLVDVYPYDPDKARELLTEAGYPDGFNTTLQFSGRWQEPQYVQVIQNQWAQIGVNVELVQKEWGAHLDELLNGTMEADMFVMAWTPVWDADQVMFRSFITDNSFNWGGYSNERVDELLMEGRVISDLEERAEIYEEAQMIVVQEAPYLFLQLTPYHVVTDSRLKNFDIGSQNWGFFDAMLKAEWSE